MSDIDFKEAAVILAALEVIPGAPHDLTEILEIAAGPHRLRDELDRLTTRETNLLSFMRQSIDVGRIEVWRRRLTRLRQDRPQAQMILATDASYPAALRQCYDRPPFLFVEGDQSSFIGKSVSIVGTRKPTKHAQEFAAGLALAAANDGFTVVSGLARGIDATAHESAIQVGRSVAVIASGIDQPIYPPENEELAARIRESGLIVSQFRPGDPITRSSFVKRNSVVSGLSLASVVVEASAGSGTQTEVDAALRQGRWVLFWEETMRAAQWVKPYLTQDRTALVSSASECIAQLNRIAQLR